MGTHNVFLLFVIVLYLLKPVLFNRCITWWSRAISTNITLTCFIFSCHWMDVGSAKCVFVYVCVCVYVFMYMYVCACIIMESIIPSRNIGCLWVLSTFVYRLLRTLVHSRFYPLPWLPIFSSRFSVFLSSCFPEGSKIGQLLISLHPVFLMCDQSNFSFPNTILTFKWWTLLTQTRLWWPSIGWITLPTAVEEMP